MKSSLKRTIGILLAVVLVLGIGAAIYFGHAKPGSTSATGDKKLTLVTGVIGSEKAAFFADPNVQKIFREHGLNVQVTTAGSRQIATTVSLKGVDFVFPSSAPAAVETEQRTGTSTVFAPFYSPMAIATFKPIVQILKNAGIASQDSDGIWHLNMAAYLKAVAAGTRWDQLPGASTLYPSDDSVLIDSTDIRQSNSAAMYLAMSSYVANGNNVVSSPSQQSAVIQQMGNLFLEQGFSASSSAEPFDDYLSEGIGSKPMVMIYESQYLGQEMSKTGSDAITKDMVLMYPDPDVFSKHTVVPLTPNGTKVGQLLVNDPALSKLAALYGFRPANPAVFNSVLKAHNLAVPPLPVDVVDPPSYETLESMIVEISNRYNDPSGSSSGSSSTPTPTPTPTPSN
jgi:hypothetical protein